MWSQVVVNNDAVNRHTFQHIYFLHLNSQNVMKLVYVCASGRDRVATACCRVLASGLSGWHGFISGSQAGPPSPCLASFIYMTNWLTILAQQLLCLYFFKNVNFPSLLTSLHVLGRCYFSHFDLMSLCNLWFLLRSRLNGQPTPWWHCETPLPVLWCPTRVQRFWMHPGGFCLHSLRFCQRPLAISVR